MRNDKRDRLARYSFAALVCLAAAIPASAGFAALATTTSSSSTLPEDFGCTLQLKLYDPVELTHLEFLVETFVDCTSEIPGVTATEIVIPSGISLDGFPPGFHGPATLVTCRGVVAHFDCQPDLDSLEVTVYEASGPAGPLPALPAICPEHIDCEKWPCNPPGPYSEQACGDADSNGTLSARDALLVLRAAVSLESCPLTVCDADRDGAVHATDARIVLSAAVGLDEPLICPAPCTIHTFPVADRIAADDRPRACDLTSPVTGETSAAWRAARARQ